MPAVTPEDAESRKIRLALRNFLAVASTGYENSKLASARLIGIAREEIAKALEPGLNARIRLMPYETYQQKKDLAYWLNCELRELGLAIRCPKTQQPSFLKASPGHDPEVGTFRLGYMDKERIRHNTFASVKLPDIDLIPNTNEFPRARPPNYRHR